MKIAPLTLVIGLACMAPASSAQEAPVRVLVSSDAEDLAGEFVALLNGRKAEARAGAIDEAALARADVAVIHRSAFTPLPAEARAALSAFTARGGGLVILHGAIAAGPAEWWKPLAGGAWTENSRKFAGRMMLYVATGQHAIVRDAWSFDVDDDTLYDLDLSPAPQVLGSAFTPKVTGQREDRRLELEKRGKADRANIYDLQPQMWAFQGPKHRAFVQLQGAPATLKHASHRVFTLRAVAWAAGREGIDSLCTKEEMESAAYPAGGPSRPAETVRQMEVHPEFTVSLTAGEPLINKPIAIQWDVRGRLWVAETPEYPNGRRPTVAEPWKETGSVRPGQYDRPALDRISILSDSDGDGVMDRKTVFYDGLELVTGFCFYRDGVLAVHQPDIVFLRDTDGDDKADKVERVLAGFAPGDSHFVANHMIPGPDGWIYASMGGNQEARSPDRSRVIGRAASGMFRFRPDGSAVEQVSSKGGNGFGASLTSDFELFFGQATTGNPLQHVVIPEWTLASGRHKPIAGANSVINGRRVAIREMPHRAPLMQIDVVGGYSAACAALVYEGGAWPEAWTRGAFVTEPILNIVHHEVLRPAGATLAGDMIRPEAEFIFCRDYWFRPIEVATGPDGAMYILDFYSPVVAHNDTRGPKHSRSGASVRPDRDHYFGRIYRVQHKQAKVLPVPDLAAAGTAERVAALKHPNGLIRSGAFRLLVEKGTPDVVSALEVMAAGEPFAPARMLALWALHRAGVLKPEVWRAALESPLAELRKTAALIAEAGGAGGMTAAGLDDPDPRARLAMMRALAKGRWGEEVAARLLAIYPALEDDWTRTAVVAVAVANPELVLAAALKEGTASGPLIAAVATRLMERRNPVALESLLAAVAAAPARADGVKAVILDAISGAKLAAPDAGHLQETLRTLLASENGSVAAAALPLAVAWGTSAALKEDVNRRVAESLVQLEDVRLSDERRMQVVVALAGTRMLPALGRLLESAASPALKRHTLAVLGTTGEPEVGALILNVLPKLGSSEQEAATGVLLSRREWVLALLDAIEARRVSMALLGPSVVFRLRTHPQKEVSARAGKVLDAIVKPSTDKDGLIASLRPKVLRPGNIGNGREVYLKSCASCHKFKELGTEVGPVLTGMGAHGPETLLVHIVDPNRALDAGYEVWNVVMKDESIQSGILAQENDAVMVLKTATGPVEVPKARIASVRKSALSLMPEGLESIGVEALRDVLAFLCEGEGRYRVLDLAGAFTADTRRGLFHSAAALGDTLQFRKFGLLPVEGIPFNIVDPSKSALGGNVVVLRGGGSNDFCSSYPEKVEIKAGVAAKAVHLLGGVAGWGAASARQGATLVTVTLHYAGGSRDEIFLQDGVHFIDYVSDADVPGSKRVMGVMRERQIRLITIPAKAGVMLEKITLSGPGRGPTAATAAITVELAP